MACPIEVLDRAGCVAAEPALAAVQGQVRRRTAAAAGRDRRLPHVHAGARRSRPQSSACSSRSTSAIERLVADGARITGVATSAGLLQADAYVVALGSWSPRLLRPLGISMPVYPVKGYSITVPITDADGAPVSTVMDESYKVAITRLGDRIRVGGTAEISGYSDKLCIPRGGRRSIIR